MKRELIWTWSAEADMQRLYATAEDHCEGNGDQLLSEVEKATALLLCFPLMAPHWRPPLRRMILRRRHLALFYVPEPRGIVVVGVADLRSDPDSLWSQLKRRLP